MSFDDVEIEKAALAILQDAIAVDADERQELLERRTQGNETLHMRVMQLLSYAENGAGPDVVTGGAIRHDIQDAPSMIGDYHIEREIGRGGMGVVYIGRKAAEDFEHRAAIKVVRSGQISGRLKDRLISERKNLARLIHPNIARLYDGGETPDGASYFVMEFVDGPPLNHYISENEPLLDERLDLFEQVCAAVAFAHQNLIIHRDLTPSNILVGSDGKPRLIDFGIAHQLADDDAEGAPGFTGTIGYSAPERQRGAAASTMSDVYSLGVILSEICAGSIAPRKRDLDAIIAKATDANPESRYPTVDALLTDIRNHRACRAVGAVKAGWRTDRSVLHKDTSVWSPAVSQVF